VIKGKRVLALIPARSGSKGLKGKNLVDLCGKPLIGWPIKVALDSKFVDRVVVSTNSKKIAAIAKKFGADAPFIRPNVLASDLAPSSSVIIHALNYLQKQGEEYDYILLLEPTSPLTLPSDIDKALATLAHVNSKKFTSIISVSKSESAHPIFCATQSKNGRLKPFLKESFAEPTRRQDLKNIFFFDGSFYISQVQYFLKHKTFIHNKTLGHEMPQWQSYEIDTQLDLTIIRAIIESRKVKK
jgi:CMP-N,N'-diacetyllegionaminic acid synthase